MDILLTACASAFCIDPNLDILNLSSQVQEEEIQWTEMGNRPLSINTDRISIGPTDNTYHLSIAEQRVFARALQRSVRILDEGSLVL
jgi:hypothetical protein